MTWAADIPTPVWVLIGVVFTAVVTYLTGRLTARAQQQKNVIDQDQNAGTMALALAKQLRDELDKVRGQLDELLDHNRAVDDWYDEHRAWDQAVTKEIEQLEPGASRRLPTLRPMPHLAHQR